MRILHVSSAHAFGGGERHFLELTEGLVNEGHEVFVVLRADGELRKRIDFLPKQNISFLPLRNSVDLFSAVSLSRIIRQEKIQIVHAHLARDYPVASIAARMVPGVKFVLSRHVLFPMKNFHKFVIGNTAKAIAVSEPAAERLKKIFPANKIENIPYGTSADDLSEHEREEAIREFRFENNIPYDALLVGTVGELSPLKGQREFVLAADLVAKEFPETYFLCCGKDNSHGGKIRRELRRLAEAVGVGKQFVWLDWVHDMAPLYASLDVFVSASHTESFGLAIAEAMASGKAVVATESEGANQLIGDEQRGILTPVNDPVSLAKAIGVLLRLPEMRRDFGANAQKYTRENLGIDRMVASTIKVYESVL